MQAYEGYFYNGRFIPIGKPINIKSKRRAVLAVFDEPQQTEAAVMTVHAEAWREFLQAVKNIKNEPVSEFERVKFRECEI